MHILVTGANGHLGQAVITHLREQLPTAQLVGLVRDPQKRRPCAPRALRCASATMVIPRPWIRPCGGWRACS